MTREIILYEISTRRDSTQALVVRSDISYQIEAQYGRRITSVTQGLEDDHGKRMFGMTRSASVK